MAGPGGSDYSAFIALGIESIACMTSGGTGHPDYHRSGDDTDKIDAKILGQTGQFVLQGVLNLANETQTNLIIPDRQHIYDAQRLTVSDMRPDAPAAGRGCRGTRSTSFSTTPSTGFRSRRFTEEECGWTSHGKTGEVKS